MKTYKEFLLEQTQSQSDILNEMSQKFNVGKTKCEINPFKKTEKGTQSGRTEENLPHIKIKFSGKEIQYYWKTDEIIGGDIDVTKRTKMDELKDKQKKKLPNNVKDTIKIIKTNTSDFEKLVDDMNNTTDLGKTVKEFEEKLNKKLNNKESEKDKEDDNNKENNTKNQKSSDGMSDSELLQYKRNWNEQNKKD